MSSSNLGGGVNGISTKQTTRSFRDSQDVITRKIVVKSWNSQSTINGLKRVSSPFPTIYNITDFLARKNYVCNVPNPIQESRHRLKSNMGSIINNCDGTGVACANTNTKFVPDSSLYTTFRRQRAINQNYNDITSVGDAHNGSFVPLMSVRRR